LEAAERQLGAAIVAGLRGRLPPRLAAHASLEQLRASTALDCVPLEAGEEILLSVDSFLGDGTGKLLESIGIDLATRALSQDGSVVRSGDLAGTVVRLQAFLEYPFVGVPLLFELRRNPAGFSLLIGITGHSRATRAVRHLTLGAIIAAERFAREVGAEGLKLSTENIAGRSNITARYLAASAEVVESDAPPSRSRRPPSVRAPAASLSAEIERILRSSAPPRPLEEEAQPPESTTLRLASAAPVRGPASKR
jgi:hypothetical protein